eukprot:UN31383
MWGIQNVPVSDIKQKVSKARKGKGHLAFPCFALKKIIGGNFNPNDGAKKIVEYLNSDEYKTPDFIASIVNEGPWINLCLGPKFIGQIIPKILDTSNPFCGSIELKGGERETVMVEYSQPNTHKAFHVGHMRNCAIGDCLIRLYEHSGHKVIAANYFWR